MSLFSEIRDRLVGGGEPPLDPAARALVTQLADEIRASSAGYDTSPDTFAAGRLLLEGGPEARLERIRVILHDRAASHRGVIKVDDRNEWIVGAIMRTTVNRLLRPRQPYTQAQLAELVRLATTTVAAWGNYDFPLGSLLGQIPSALGGAPMDAALAARLHALRTLLAKHDRAEIRRALTQIDAVLSGDAGTDKPLEPRGPAGTSILTDVARLPESERAAWTALLRHGLTLTSATASGTWLTRARALVEAIGVEAFTGAVLRWLAHGPTPGAARDVLATEADADLLKGLVWTASTVESAALAGAVGDLAIACFRKIPNFGAVSTKAGNACLGALGRMPTMDAVAQLGRVRTMVKYAQAQRLIDKALAAAAERTGMSAMDLEEVAVPTLGFDADGIRRRLVGDATAETAITGSIEVALTWVTAAGRRQTSVPAEVRAGHAAAVTDVRKGIKDAERMLQAQRDRIEALLLAPRTWDGPAWRTRYLDHPLLGAMCRRLIWRVQRRTATVETIWSDGRLVDVGDRPLESLDGDARVSLWHPLDSDIGTITAWRHWLEAHEVTQPFKQAHREVYLLTHAERATATYSNRFAAHVLRQHQFAALCQQRAWRYTLQGQWDSHNVPTRELPGGALRAEFWVEAPGDGPTSAAAVYLHVVTDQVRFVTADGTPQPLAQIEPRLFSEVMREVDLFVGVSSIAADPTWRDHGARPGFGEYWERTAFGELSASAQTRREVLERLVPKLKIAARCSVDDRFLTVRGDRKTYRIHLGSGNIMMEPGSQYLCIVADRNTRGTPSGRLWLPFEGDTTLSLILSKAFLLAADSAITDPTILSQLAR